MMRLKCITKIKLYQNLLFSSKKRQNIIEDCCTRLYYASFHMCGCQISRVQIPEWELLCCKNIFSAQSFIYVLQSGNHAQVLALYCRSTAGNDLKTATSKLEFSFLNESVTQPACVLSWDLGFNVCYCGCWINAYTQPLFFNRET